MILPGLIAAKPAGGGGGYTASAVHFDAGAYLARGSTLTGVTDSPTGTLFYWFRSDPAALVGQNVMISMPGYNVDPYDQNNIVNTTVSDGTNQFGAVPDFFTTPDVDDGAWYGIARSWDVSDPDSANWTCVTVIGETGEAPTAYPPGGATVRVGVGFNAKWNDVDFFVMGDGSEDVFREVAQFWATAGVVMTGPQLIAAFWGNDNKPKNLGVNGELPTGSAPAIYCDGNAASWATNKGTGGGFSVVGDALTNASTSPSD